MGHTEHFFQARAGRGACALSDRGNADCSRTIVSQDKELVRDLRSINVRTHAGALLIIDKSGWLQNAADREYCLQYILAVKLLKGELLEYADYQYDSK